MSKKFIKKGMHNRSWLKEFNIDIDVLLENFAEEILAMEKATKGGSLYETIKFIMENKFKNTDRERLAIICNDPAKRKEYSKEIIDSIKEKLNKNATTTKEKLNKKIEQEVSEKVEDEVVEKIEEKATEKVEEKVEDKATETIEDNTEFVEDSIIRDEDVDEVINDTAEFIKKVEDEKNKNKKKKSIFKTIKNGFIKAKNAVVNVVKDIFNTVVLGVNSILNCFISDVSFNN